MVKHSTETLDRVFRALSDPSRRSILRSLSAGERTVGELAAPLSMSLAAASKHIKALEDAGLMRRTKRGRTHYCRLEARPMAGAQEWLRFYERFWSERLDALEQVLKDEDENPTPSPPTPRSTR